MTTNCIVILALIFLLAISLTVNFVLSAKLEKANEKLEVLGKERRW